MKTPATENIYLYGPEDEVPHNPESAEIWQESVVIYVWDPDDGEVTADLVMEDFHQGFGFWSATAKALSEEVARNHIEASGRVTGDVTMRGKTYKLKQAVGYRDHSWGERRWNVMRSHRWTPAIFGPDLSCQAVAWYGADGSLSRFGYLVLDEEMLLPDSMEIVCYAENDGITNLEGKVTLNLPGGEVIECHCEAVAPGGFSDHHGYPCVDVLCRTRLGDREGVGCFEAGFNSFGGTSFPDDKILVNGPLANGIFAY